ncbi:MAG: 1-deoxy-D-xylulose-5-phosphate synthase [Phycisphaerales bacterium]|nr:1-deoxy-D-xylulose-5-phosphate synthase [Phycisphaerales bacterium]
MTSLLSTIHSPADLRKLTVEQLPQLAQEIRAAICDQVGKSGGHLAPNLGVVELTIALHYVFDFGPDGDRLLFDVGHQCYPHKLLTGRLPMLDGLRTSSGMSGFPEPSESGHDLFRVGHAGTAISCGVGMARGDSLGGQGYDPESNKTGRRVACVVGDASIVNGVAMEGLNGAGTLKRQFLVVLNDNGMSISKPQGALAQYFDRVRVSHLYSDLKKRGKDLLKDLPGGSLIREAYHVASEAAKAVRHDGVAAGSAGGGWFEHFGLVTVGPIDGHDLPTLIEFLTEARDFDRPMVLHVKTIKGKGFDFAEGDASKFHSPSPFVREGCRVELKKEGRSFTSAVGDAMVALMERDEKVVVATAAMPDGTGVSKVLPLFPERTFDTGICESHALDMMAGLAKTGFKPFFCVYATFLQRAFDQAFQEASLQGLPVRLLLDRAGLVGGDGSVHHGFCDISLLRVLPGAAIMAAIDEPSMLAAMEFMRGFDTGLSSLRYPRDNVSDAATRAGGVCPPFELGKARCLTPELNVSHTPATAAPDVAVLAFGTPAIDSLKAAESLKADYRVAVYDARFAKPVDHALIHALISRNIPIVTVEDHGLIGGFGAAVLESAQHQNLDASRIVRLGLPDSWIIQDSRASQLAEAGIDAAGIARGVRAAAELGVLDRMLAQPDVRIASPLARETANRR